MKSKMQIRSVFNVDQSQPQDVGVPTTFEFRSDGDRVLRVTRAPTSCIRHCCPADDVFFSSEKEFDLWADVLKSATTNLWDGENVQLLLHGPASNMSLFQMQEETNSLSQTVPQNVDISSQQGNESKGALTKILRALLRETAHRHVPEHYKASVAVGACVMRANGSLRDIAPPTAIAAVLAAEEAQANSNNNHNNNNDNFRREVVLDRHGHEVEVSMIPMGTAEDVTQFTNHLTQECAEMLRVDIQKALLAAAAASDDGHAPSPLRKPNGLDASVHSPEGSPTASVAAPSPAATNNNNRATFEEKLEQVGGEGEENEEDEGSMLLLSVQLRQWCSVSPPKVSYLRITQIIHTPRVIEEALLSIARNRPLPSFAANLSKTLVQRVSDSSQLVFVQSATPRTALAALPCLAAAKGSVVRAELAAVATDIVQASEQFLTNREALREKLRSVKEELRRLRTDVAAKERNLTQQSTFSPTGGGGGGGGGGTAAPPVFRATGFASATASPLAGCRGGGDHATFFNEVGSPKSVPHQGSTRNIKAGTHKRQQQKIDDEAEERANAAEEALFQFHEFSEAQKRKVENHLETLQYQISQNSAKCLSLRASIEEMKKKMETDQMDQEVALAELKKTLAFEYERLLANGEPLPGQRHDSVDLTTSVPNTGRVLSGRTTSRTTNSTSSTATADTNNDNNQTQPQQESVKQHPLTQAERLAMHRAKLLPNPRVCDRASMNEKLRNEIATRTAELVQLQNSVLAEDKRDQSVEEKCRQHCNALVAYSKSLYDVFLFVEKAAKKTHSFDPSMVPDFENVKLIAAANDLSGL